MNPDTRSTCDREGTLPMPAPDDARARPRAHTATCLRTGGVLLATVLTVAACGNQPTDNAKPTSRSTRATASAAPPSTPTPSRTPSRAPTAKEQITAAGVAAVVTDHLGADKVAAFGSYGGEPGTVDLMIRLRGGGRADNFAVTVYSPKRGGKEFRELTKCPHGKRAKEDKYTRKFTCHRLKNGTTVTAYLTSYGFSDDNTHGHVITGVAGAPDGSVTMALYESYDRTAPVTVTDIDRLLSDPRLTWKTDPAANAAGKRLRVPKLRE